MIFILQSYFSYILIATALAFTAVLCCVVGGDDEGEEYKGIRHKYIDKT